MNTFLRATSCTWTRWKWRPAPANRIFRPDALGVAAGPGEHIFARHFLRPDALELAKQITVEQGAGQCAPVPPHHRPAGLAAARGQETALVGEFPTTPI